MSVEEQAQAILDRYRPRLEETLRAALEGEGDLLAMMRYHLGLGPGPQGEPPGLGGKMLRGALCLLCCEASGGTVEQALTTAAAYELVHGFTLLHDDIMDRDETRRGRPTVWKLWGVGQAITAGDAMYAQASLLVLEGDVDIGCRYIVLQELHGAVRQVCDGQQRDLAFEGRTDVGVRAYLDMVAYKTGALFRAACTSGGQIGGGTPSDPRDHFEHRPLYLGIFGSQLGEAFQIRDDILGLWGEEEELGKPVGSDLRQNKRSLPILQALASQTPLAQRLRDRLGKSEISAEEAAVLAAEMKAAGIRLRCEELLQDRYRAALATLASRRIGPLLPGPLDDLRTLATYLVERTR